MNWQTKAAIQAVLSRVPRGEQIHRRLQDIAGTAVEASADYGRRRNFLNVLRGHGLNVRGSNFMEVGTGWHPMLPLLLSLLGAGGTITVDLHRWLTARSLGETLDVLERCAERFGGEFGVPPDHVRQTVRDLREMLQHSGGAVDDVLHAVNVDYRCPADATGTHLPEHSMDYVVSTNVLEHVRPAAIWGIMKESSRILKPGGFIVHHIDLGDHFSYDKHITTINFLQYSPKTWYFIGGSGIAYHNRLRSPEYLDMVKRAGFEIVEDGAQIDPRALDALTHAQVHLHRAFSGYSDEQLCVRTLVLIARTAR